MYCQFYNFSAKPFENTPDPDFLFLSKNHREVLASLSYGITAGKGFMLVVGDVGTGKTTLIHALINQLDPNFIIIHIINPKTSFKEIVHHICRKLEIIPNGLDELELVDAIREQLITLEKDGIRLVLIIDEAHHLSREALEEIRLISNIESEKKKLIQIALVGQIELYRTLQHDNLRQLKQRIILSRSLVPLDKKETFAYIQHRLNVAGRRDQIFSNSALNLIWEKSKGIPRVINQLCDNALVIGLALEATTINRKIVKEAIQDMESSSELIKDVKRSPLLNWKLAGAIAALGGVILLARFWNVNSLVPFHHSSMGVPAESGKGNVIDNRHTEKGTISPEPAAEREVEVDKKEPPISSKELDVPDHIHYAESSPHSERKRVRPGDTLTNIVSGKYGIANDTLYDLIQMANSEIQKLNLIYANQEIILPEINKKDLIVKDGNGKYYIHYASSYSLGNAREEIQALKSQTQKVFLFTVLMGKELTYRIYLGVFKDYSQAEKALQKIDFKYLPFLNDDSKNS